MLPDHRCIILPKVSIPRLMRSSSGSCDILSDLARKSRANSTSPWMKNTYRPANSKVFISRPDESRRCETAVHGFINYLKKPARHPAGGYEEGKAINPEP